MDKRDLAKLICRDIFECGDEPDSPAQRLQYMGGTYPNDEVAQGGLCPAALTRLITRSLETHLDS